jgi:hypothetical protein
MSASAGAMVIAGIAALFLPQELLAAIGVPATGVLPAIVQLHGALLLGFAMVNWMAKDSLIGGIYNRPVGVGNLLHFATGAITLVKLVIRASMPMSVIVAAAVYGVFAIGFAMIVFGRPVKTAQPLK